MAAYRARFFYDWGSGRCLWSANDLTRAAFDYPINHESLPLSTELGADIERLVARYDESMNADYPPDPGPWRERECEEFNRAVHAVIAGLRRELGPDWEIVDDFAEFHEDPDLDRYEADPRNFQR